MRQFVNIVFVALLFSVVACDTANNVSPVFESSFIKYYGDQGDQFGVDLEVESDGTFAILGNSLTPAGINQIVLIKADAKGEVLWEQKIGEPGDVAIDLEKNSSGYVILANVGPESTSRIRVIKVNTSGSTTNSVLVPLHNKGIKQVATSITSLVGGGYVITGYADKHLMVDLNPVTENIDNTDILAFRYDESLTQLDTVLRRGGESTGAAIKAFSFPPDPTRVAVFGYSNRPVFTNDFEFNYLYSVPFEGIPSSYEGFAGTSGQHELLACVIQTPPIFGEGFLLSGTALDGDNTFGEVYLVRYNNTFSSKWLNKKVALPGRLRCVHADNAAFGYVLLVNEVGDGDLQDMMVAEVNLEGDVLWSTKFGTREGNDTGAAIRVLPDGRIAVLGTMELKTRKKMALIVTNPQGSI